MFNNLFKDTKEKNIIGLTDELKCIYINNLLKNNKPKLIVTNTLYEANKLYKSLLNYNETTTIFPMDDFLTSEALAISPELKYTRLETINNIINNKTNIVVTNLMGYLRYLPKKETFINSKIKLKIGNILEIKELVDKLFNIGYIKETVINKTGDIAIRGFVVDIFPISSKNPVRIEFWGDEITSIRLFNIDTQKTYEEIKEITIEPITEFITNNDTFGLKHREIVKYEGYNNIESYFDEMDICYINLNDIKNANKLLLEEMLEYQKSNEDEDINYMNLFENTYKYDNYVFETLNNFISKNDLLFKSSTIDILDGNLENIKKRILDYTKTKTVVICLSNRYKINKVIDQFDNELFIQTDEYNLIENKVNLIIKNIENGFIIDNYVVISENELFNKKESNINYKSNFRMGTRIKDITKLSIGDYVVHNKHGIGRYLGIKKIIKNNLEKDYLEVEYKNSDKLYIPVEKIDLINKYSSKEGAIPKLNKLGGTEWQKTKLRTRKKIESIAKELLELYAKRESAIGYKFDKDDENQIIFESEFAYNETEDQIKVTNEIKKDMEKANPMDRLLCGDVGYGKTEVAFRAIFKAILSKKQVALLCPTTILSSQHYNNAIERFKSFPVNISLINRFIKPSQLKKEIQKIKEGKVDLIIGTHRILSDDIEFKDLGLLVIDEEQRFGVKHKEKIKTFKNNIDILTLSATPIPRTLQMSMTGIRSLSLIETPPVNKLPVQTYVLAENTQIIKDAIYKELSREGQTFILYNRIDDMETKKEEIQKLVPEARIVTAHGRMDKNELEDVMYKFTNHEYDVLLCTTIIETGIDIPRANTLLIMDADRFGLSQLYQIRGRVGRSQRIAYCYLMYDKKKILTEIATKRLKVIKDFTELGSGFAIAMRDMAIRGAGDILGQEQAGFVDSIGIELFLKMLNEEVEKLKGNKIEEEQEENQPLIEVATSISDDYIMDTDLKIEIHKKINSITNKETLNEVKEELEDRFGKLSEDLIIYMHEEWFEKLASTISIERIRQNKNSVEITLTKELTNNINGETLFLEAMKLSRMIRFQMKLNKLTLILDTIKLDKHFVYYLIELVEIIKNNIKKTQ